MERVAFLCVENNRWGNNGVIIGNKTMFDYI